MLDPSIKVITVVHNHHELNESCLRLIPRFTTQHSRIGSKNFETQFNLNNFFNRDLKKCEQYFIHYTHFSKAAHTVKKNIIFFPFFIFYFLITFLNFSKSVFAENEKQRNPFITFFKNLQKYMKI